MKPAALLLVSLLAAAPAMANEGLPAAPEAPQEQSLTDRYLGKARELAVQALGLIGINYKWGGSTPETGFDCSGFVVYIFKQAAGLVLPRTSFDIARVGEKVEREELQPGDLVFFNTLRRPFSHVGIYLGENRFIHAPSRGGSVEITDMTNRYWTARYNGARRVAM